MGPGIFLSNTSPSDEIMLIFTASQADSPKVSVKKCLGLEKDKTPIKKIRKNSYTAAFVPIGGITECCQEGLVGQGDVSAIHPVESTSCLVGYY